MTGPPGADPSAAGAPGREGAERILRRGRLSGQRIEYVVPADPAGRAKRDRFHISQAVIVGGVLEISGQSGAEGDGSFAADTAEQVDRALANVETVLRAAGAGWPDVVAVTSYHVDPVPGGAMERGPLDRIAAHFRRTLPDHPPVWTAVAVAGLAHPGMRVEISVRAVL